MEYGSAALLVWIPILAALLAPGVAIVFSKRAKVSRKLLWLGIMIAGYLLGEVLAGLYARGRINPMNPDFSEVLTAMVIELSATIALVWLAYVGFRLHTRERKPHGIG